MEKYFIAAISAANHIGSKRFRQLLNFFGTAEKIWSAAPKDFQDCGLQKKPLESFLQFRSEHPAAPENLMKYCASKKINLCSFVDEDYPPILKEISTPPAIFYYRGILEPFAERIAIVGTREFSDYGRRAAKIISEDLARAGITVVSGAARGIDTISHSGAMKFGRTVAVLGCGINFNQGYEKQKFLNEIVESGGLVLSEFEPTLQPQAGTFPTRNRIIAGLSRGVVVIEAGKKSGALITSEFAADFSREVFSVPHNIFSESGAGCNKLIRDGATLITSAKDILDFYDFVSDKNLFDSDEEISDKKNSEQKNSEQKISEQKISSKKSSAKKILISPPIVLDEIEKKVFNLIPFDENITVDEILMQTDELEPNEISEVLLKLEIKKVVQEIDGVYSRIN